jgi:tRNA(fMet)-specific endonuclease VapC
LIYLLDTNTCIQYITRRNSPVVQKLRIQKRSDVALCDIVKLELYYGAYKSQRQERNLEVLEEFFQEFVSLPFDGNVAKICGQIRAQLAAVGTPIGPFDLQIAAIALAHDLTLVTHNTKEFSRVEGLRLDDWEVTDVEN